MNDHDQRADHQDGPVRQPWLSWADWFIIVGIGSVVAFIVYVYFLRKILGRTGN